MQVVSANVHHPLNIHGKVLLAKASVLQISRASIHNLLISGRVEESYLPEIRPVSLGGIFECPRTFNVHHWGLIKGDVKLPERFLPCTTSAASVQGKLHEQGCMDLMA